MDATHLILSRKETEAVELTTATGEKITVKVEQIRGNRVKLGFNAARSVGIKRMELGGADGSRNEAA